MTAIAYSTFSDDDRPRAQPGLMLWIGGSLALHVMILLWILIQPERPPMTLSDSTVRDKPPVEIVQVTPRSTVASMPEPVAIADTPKLELPPVHRVKDGTFDIVDPIALQRFLAREAAREKVQDGGMGDSWTTCSLMSPERRALEPACDGYRLARAPGGVAVTLQAPDGEVLAAAKKYDKDFDKPDPTPAGENNTNDRSYRDQSDDVFGPKPWER